MISRRSSSWPWRFATRASAYIYWTNYDGHHGRDRQPRRFGRQPELHQRRAQPLGVAVDANNSTGANTGPGTIGRANLDSSGVNQSFISGVSGPFGVAVDGGHVYWTNSGYGTIGRANLDGSGANQSFITGTSIPYGVAVDKPITSTGYHQMGDHDRSRQPRRFGGQSDLHQRRPCTHCG